MQGIAENQTDKDQEKALIRVEANVEEWPVFSASKKSGRNREVVVWKREGRDPQTGGAIDQEMKLNPSVEHGLPGERERDLYYLVIAPWLDDHGFGPDGRVGPIRYQDACRMLGWQRTGPNYNQLRKAVQTLSSLNIEFRNAIMDGKTRRLLEYGTHLFSEYRLETDSPALQPEKVQRGEFTLRAADWFLASWEANYRKPLSATVYRGLRTPLAKALYSYLDKRAWSKLGYRSEVSENLNELRDRFRLGVRATKNLLQEFRRAHEDLKNSWPLLREVRLEKIRPGHYRVVYVFSNQVELKLEPAPPADTAPGAGERAADPLVQELRLRGLLQPRAEDLVRRFPADQIRRHLDVHDQELKRQPVGQTKNPAGSLYKRITEGWEPFDGYRPPELRDRARTAKLAAEAKERAEHERRRREQAEWDALPPAGKAEKRTARWADMQTAMNRQPTPEEREAKYREYLREHEDAPIS